MDHPIAVLRRIWPQDFESRKFIAGAERAHTQSAEVEVRHRDGQLHVRVTDAGDGFDPAQLWTAGGTAGGFGLFTIRERLGAEA